MSRRWLLALLLVQLAGSSRAAVTLIGVGTIPGTAADLSGLTEKQTDGTPQNRLGGLGSAIAHTGKGNEYVLASDRGPKDGATDYVCRTHRMTIDVIPGANSPVGLKLTGTTLLTDEKGRRLIGTLDAFDPKDVEKSRRLDPEGIRVGRGGTSFISDEYGPVIYEFDAKGHKLRSIPVPARYRPAKPGKLPADELPPRNKLGRQPNRGMEGLAISPDGAKLYGIMQGPLIQDGALDKDNARIGLNCRILELDIATGQTREFVYRLDDPSHGLNEILAINDHEFLVIERDGKGGPDAGFKKVFQIDIAGASDVSKVESLPSRDLLPRIQPVKKKLFLDLLAKEHKIAGLNCPEKFEGLTFGPDLPDGRRLLLVTADNDFVAEQPFRVYAFAVDPGDLPDYCPQQFEPRR